MKYCPECETEYLDHAVRCADCGCELIDEASFAARRSEGAAPAGAQEPMVTACAVGDQVEADQLLELLARARIPAHLHTFGETVYIGHTDLHQGFGEIWVPRAWLHAARALIDEFWCSPPPPWSDDEP